MQDMRTTAAEGISVINIILARLNVPQKKIKSQQGLRPPAAG